MSERYQELMDKYKAITSKKLVYAKGIPEQMKYENFDAEYLASKDSYFQKLDELRHLKRARRGVDDWNAWVQWAQLAGDRWLVHEDKGDETRISLKPTEGRPWEDDYYTKNGIDFGDGLRGEDGKFDCGIEKFSRFIFPCPISFKGATFTRGARFSEATFTGDATFREAAFTGDATFKEAAFTGDVTFREVAFTRGAYFEGAIFTKGAGFSEATFIGGAYFLRATFTGVAYFVRATVGFADFSEVTFIGVATFSEVTFTGYAYFLRATFTRDATFSESIFKKGIVSRRAVFFGRARWDTSIFSAFSDFREAQFLHETSFMGADFKAYADFDHACFGKARGTDVPIQYKNWDDGLKDRYNKATVQPDSETIPNFKGTSFGSPPNLGYTEVAEIPAKSPTGPRGKLKQFWGFGWKETRIDDPDAAAKLRSLQEQANKGHHSLAEKKFFRNELLSRRGHEAKSWREIAMINLFELFSGCGLSFWKPVDWWLRAITVCALVYLANILPGLEGMTMTAWAVTFAIAGLCLWYPKEFLSLTFVSFMLMYWQGGTWTFAGISAHTWGELVTYSGLNSLPLVGLASESYGVAVKYLFGGAENMPLAVRFVAFLQNVVSAVFLFFALLAVRNYFKLS